MELEHSIRTFVVDLVSQRSQILKESRFVGSIASENNSILFVFKNEEGGERYNFYRVGADGLLVRMDTSPAVFQSTDFVMLESFVGPNVLGRKNRDRYLCSYLQC